MIASSLRIDEQLFFGISEVDRQAEWDLARAIVISSYQAAGGRDDLPCATVDRQICKIPSAGLKLSPDDRCVIRMNYVRMIKCTTLVWLARPGKLVLEVATYHGTNPLGMLEDAVVRYKRWKETGENELDVPLCWTNFQGLTPDEV